MDYDPYFSDLAKAISGYIFRNGLIEDYHAEGCISNAQMKALSKFMIDRLGFVLCLLYNDKTDDLNLLLGFHFITCKKYDDVDYSVGEAELAKLRRIIKRDK